MVQTTRLADLIRFLLARVDEDDQDLARRHRRVASRADHDAATMTALHREQAELLAKRRVIGHLQHLLVLRDLPAEKPVRDTVAVMLQAMAAPYREHRLFRAEWDVSRERTAHAN